MYEDLKSIISEDMFNHLDVCAEQIQFWRERLDVFIEEYLKIRLYDTQRVVARAIGNDSDISIAMNRGYGKTWLLGVCAVALCILWPDTPVAVVSNTAVQANLLLQKIDRDILPNDEIERELDRRFGRGIRIKDNGNSIIFFKNGSRIQSFVLGHEGKSALGQRAKILIIDEAKLVPDSIVNKVLKPIISYKRPIYHKMEGKFVDYDSKVINISSAYFKSCDFFNRYRMTLHRMGRGDEHSFACALNFESCARIGLQDIEYYEREKEAMSPVEFAMEYGTVFVGASDDSVFPYSVTEPCRVLTSVELFQPKDTQCKYVICADLAGSTESASADNSCISVIKIIEKSDHRWQKHLVWMGAYKGWSQRQIAEEIRKLYLRFPNTVRIVYDKNGLGQGMENVFDQPWAYEDDKGIMREMRPLLAFDSKATFASEKILYPFIANNALNAEMAQIVLRNLDDKDLRLPVMSTSIEHQNTAVRLLDSEDDEKTTRQKKKRTMLMTEEIMVFKEADALQAEMGNIVCRPTPSGNMNYDVAVSTQKKDRYSSLGMAMWNIDQMETSARREAFDNDSDNIPIFIGRL